MIVINDQIAEEVELAGPGVLVHFFSPASSGRKLIRSIVDKVIARKEFILLRKGGRDLSRG